MEHNHEGCGCNAHNLNPGYTIDSPEVIAYLRKPYKRLLHQIGTPEHPNKARVEVLEFDELYTESNDGEGIIEQSVLDMKAHIAYLLNNGIRVPEPGEISEHRIPKPKTNEQNQVETYEIPPPLDLVLQQVNSNSWTFGNSGFALIYEAEPDEYYLIDLVNGAADEGEAVNVFKFPNKQKTPQQELEGIQEWFTIFYHGFGYAYTKQYRMEESIRNKLNEEVITE